jgi:tRNA(Ile)-lysidine synthase
MKAKTSIHLKVLASVGEHGMVRAGDRLGLAVSGGADSVALLRLMEDLRAQLGISLAVLHFNHELRGAESDADEEFVKSLALEHEFEYFASRANVAEVARQRRWNLEDAARRLRYEFFSEIVGQGKATRIATAHTADDQAETVLARMIRGTGLAGLGAIHPVREHVIRPLFHVRREALRDFLRARGQAWREDATNADTRRLRARLRHALLPLLQKDFSPAIVDRLCSLADLARDDENLWSALVEERIERAISRHAAGFGIRIQDLLCPFSDLSRGSRLGNEAFAALTQRMIRRLHAELAAGEAPLSRQHVEQVISLGTKLPSGRRVALPGGIEVRRAFDRLEFRIRDVPASSSGRSRALPARESYQYEVTLPSSGSATVTVAELGRSFRLKLIDWPMTERDTSLKAHVLDAERLAAPLLLRNWRPGDAYRPLGRRQRRKLKQMFVAGRIDVTERASWPVLVSGGKVAWAHRMPAAAEFSASASTRVALSISEECP